MVVKYEDFLTEPCGFLRKLCRFCRLDAGDESIVNAAQSVKKSRAYAYKESPSLQAFAERVSSRLVKHGY